MLKTLQRAVKIPELRKKLMFTLLMLVVYRIGANITVPGIDRQAIQAMMGGTVGGALGLYDLISGGSLNNFTLFALGVTPYITASIVLQLLAVAIPSLEEIQKSGEEGQKKISAWTRYLAVLLALMQAAVMSLGLFRSAFISTSVLSTVAVILTLTAGTTFLMWIGEMITERGVGNGTSMLIFFGIVSRLPFDVRLTVAGVQAKNINIVQLIGFLIISVLIVVGVIIVLQGTRRIPVEYAKRVVGKNTYGGKQSHLPLKVNQAGVMPVILASSLLSFPLFLTLFVKAASYQAFVQKWFNPSHPPGMYLYALLQFIMVIGFSYFYISITFKPDEVAENMKNSNGFIPGVRPGKATEVFIKRILDRLTFAGAIFLAIIAALPTVLFYTTNVPFKFGGTSLLIVVGVAIETMKQLESQTVMRSYQGFLK
ncbi:MAG: preprotein translocase subunit SecY [Peptostreptococcaceae bacterium]|nr:preprotein translocase subunit SecY [Peptostreptococcaceae bacterium]